MDWKAAFIKYAWLVGEYEGVDFLYRHDWSEFEWAEISEIRNLGYERDYGQG